MTDHHNCGKLVVKTRRQKFIHVLFELEIQGCPAQGPQRRPGGLFTYRMPLFKIHQPLSSYRKEGVQKWIQQTMFMLKSRARVSSEVPKSFHTIQLFDYSSWHKKWSISSYKNFKMQPKTKTARFSQRSHKMTFVYNFNSRRGTWMLGWEKTSTCKRATTSLSSFGNKAIKLCSLSQFKFRNEILCRLSRRTPNCYCKSL